MTDDNPKAKTWQQEIRLVAHEAMTQQADPSRPGDPAPDLLLGPIELVCRFVLARPIGHYGTGRNAGSLRLSAPMYPTVKPDATKLVRAVEDALTGTVWRDDAQVVYQRVSKAYGTPERVEIVVFPIVAQA